ncbi:hypothetical protein P170DRAFT_33911 [Aspergillus steynii IBT 23096]|uniref:Uncharacterized protein n=1 Tax=Aspergillus steynii IBT 23096 TaxID=1392250 RepID=A0A2I2GQK6_9EURO|nr:uncharacterized protein P170DRAFT_33911 [Aspergillus steynii IBT 23096]PLB55150.1 hypothetical protein P170DRAFT_33911 [Aspergillus steynii IBT 23096]
MIATWDEVILSLLSGMMFNLRVAHSLFLTWSVEPLGPNCPKKGTRPASLITAYQGNLVPLTAREGNKEENVGKAPRNAAIGLQRDQIRRGTALCRPSQREGWRFHRKVVSYQVLQSWHQCAPEQEFSVASETSAGVSRSDC